VFLGELLEKFGCWIGVSTVKKFDIE